MKKYISKEANLRIREYISSLGYDVELVSTSGIVGKAISCHPDIFLCKMGISDDAKIFPATALDLGLQYPKDAAFCAACTGKFFIHNLSITSSRLLEEAISMNMKLIDVKQGYSKCNISIVDENSIITSDKGIVKSCASFSDLDVLEISPGHIQLWGFDTGFIGGASARVGNQMIFNGSLTAHPDFRSIVEFVESKGITCRWFPEYPLTDIGSIV